MQVILTSTGQLIIPSSLHGLESEACEWEGTYSELDVFTNEISVATTDYPVPDIDFSSLCEIALKGRYQDPAKVSFCSDITSPDLPETAGKCYCDWVSDLSDVWGQLDHSSMTLACEVAHRVYDEDLLSELARLGVMEA